MADVANIGAINSSIQNLFNVRSRGAQDAARLRYLDARTQNTEASTNQTLEETRKKTIETQDAARASQGITALPAALVDVIYPQIEAASPVVRAPVQTERPMTLGKTLVPAGTSVMDGPGEFAKFDKRQVPVTKEQLVNVVAPVAAQGGNAQQMTKAAQELMSTFGIFFGDEALARRGAVAGGMNTGPGFAATTPRADVIRGEEEAGKNKRNTEDNASREKIAADKLKADRADGAKSPMPSDPEKIAQFDSLVDQRIGKAVSGADKAGEAISEADRASIRRRAGELTSGNKMDVGSAIDQAIAEQFGKGAKIERSGGILGFGSTPSLVRGTPVSPAAPSSLATTVAPSAPAPVAPQPPAPAPAAPAQAPAPAAGAPAPADPIEARVKAAHPTARKAPNGKWYVQKDGKFFEVDAGG